MNAIIVPRVSACFGSTILLNKKITTQLGFLAAAEPIGYGKSTD